MKSESDIRSNAWLVVGLLWVVACLNYLDRIMITTMRGSLMEDIPMTDAQFGMLTAVFLWVYGLLSPMAGFLADRFSRSRIIIFSLITWSVITWLTGQAKTFEQLLVARAFMGISEACYIPAALALIADYHRGSTRSLATGIHVTGVTIGSGLGGVAGWIAEKQGWTYAFGLFGVVGIAYGIMLLFLLRDASATESKEHVDAPKTPVKFGEALGSLLGRGSFLLLIAFWALTAVASWGVTGWMPTYLGEHFQLDQGEAGLSATVFHHSASVVGLIAGGFWADRWSRTRTRARILVPVIGLCFAVPGLMLAANSSVLTLAIFGLMVYGMSRSFTDSNMMPILCMVVDPRYRATGFGVLNMFACIVGGTTIYLGGVLRDRNVDVSYVFCFSAVGLLVCAVLLFLVRPAPSTEPLSEATTQ
jgi:predicted MFS family arabinose efflux permease